MFWVIGAECFPTIQEIFFIIVDGDGPMLLNDDVLFLHIPKTAGMSLSRILLDKLPSPLHYYLPLTNVEYLNGLAGRYSLNVVEGKLPKAVQRTASKAEARSTGDSLERKELIIHDGRRHGDLQYAVELLPTLNKELSDFRYVLVCIRNPYDLEVSRYHYLRKNNVEDRNDPAQAIALNSDFETFATTTRPWFRVRRFCEFGGKVPPNMKFIYFENLRQDLDDVLGSLGLGPAELPHINPTVRKPYQEYITPKSELAIYENYRWLFNQGYYEREDFSDNA